MRLLRVSIAAKTVECVRILLSLIEARSALWHELAYNTTALEIRREGKQRKLLDMFQFKFLATLARFL